MYIGNICDGRNEDVAVDQYHRPILGDDDGGADEGSSMTIDGLFNSKDFYDNVVLDLDALSEESPQHCLAQDIVSIIACEGVERVERHEILGKWRVRLGMAGFAPLPLSSFVNGTIKRLLESYCKKYTLKERDGCLYLGWMNRNLVASCAWV
ncbi:scarecrow-like transcription factor pat1 [Phtheirospermum japonicum]|uniref:Scarecrow-like transcription factor pat1 n=1 Tax=Phtheirospermum japonicum TaxID=374723 RepID=A0A830BNM0_9LAMI|nr:scarecrow-like transcription factor pat1 [Phtheirospermum japonicum]